MRTLGAAYDAALAQPVARPCFRVQFAGHGGVFADPFDATQHVAHVEVTRPLRAGNAATILLHSEGGQFDPASGAYALAVMPANAQVRIDLGEVLNGVETFWRVFTGEVASCRPRYGVPVQTVELECLDRAINPWQHEVTTPNYGISGVTPVGWTAHLIIRDLFERFLGFVWPGDFALDPASDWTLENDLQLQQSAICDAAEAVLAPVGYRLYFDYWGRAASGLLVPAGAPAAWPLNLTVPAENVANDGIDGPTVEPPEATRVQVVGGLADHDLAQIGQDSIWATVRVHVLAYKAAPMQWGLQSVSGDAFSWTLGLPIPWSTFNISVNGRREDQYRVGASAVSEIRFVQGNVGLFSTPPYVVFGSESYDPIDERQEAQVRMVFLEPVGTPTHLEFEFDVSGHQGKPVRPQVYAQAWDDALIGRWDEKRARVDAPACFNWNRAHLVAGQEMTVASLSESQSGIPLCRLDLRIEPGDVVDVENPGGATVRVWVREVFHSCAPDRSETHFEGYVI